MCTRITILAFARRVRRHRTDLASGAALQGLQIRALFDLQCKLRAL
jgi:hypothetical protein